MGYIPGSVPRGLGKSRQLVTAKMHLPLSGDMEARDPQQQGGGALRILFVPLDPFFFPGGHLLRTLLFELPCWPATSWVWLMSGTGRKPLNKDIVVISSCSRPVLVCVFGSISVLPGLHYGQAAPLSQSQSSLDSGATFPLPCPLMLFHCYKCVCDVISSVFH